MRNSPLFALFRQSIPMAVAVLAACSTVPPPSAIPVPGPAVTTVMAVERGWHTDICLRTEDAGPWLMALAQGYNGARFLCFGFGERQYVVTHDHGPLVMLSALLPSQSALLMTVLRDSPSAAFGAANVVGVGVDRAGLSGLQAFLRRSVQTDDAGKPVRLGEGPYPGSAFFGATGTYDAFHTCNTWTASALRSAGLPVDDTVLFAGGVMRQARQLAAPSINGAP